MNFAGSYAVPESLCGVVLVRNLAICLEHLARDFTSEGGAPVTHFFNFSVCIASYSIAQRAPSPWSWYLLPRRNYAFHQHCRVPSSKEEIGLAAAAIAGCCRKFKYATCTLHGPRSVLRYQSRPPSVPVAAANITAESVHDTPSRITATPASIAMSTVILYIRNASS